MMTTSIWAGMTLERAGFLSMRHVERFGTLIVRSLKGLQDCDPTEETDPI